jgi:hypothetical protein
MMKLTRIAGPARRRVRVVRHTHLLGRDELTMVGQLRYGASVGDLVLDDEPWLEW